MMSLAAYLKLPARPWRRFALAVMALLSVATTGQTFAAEDHPFGKGLLWRIERPGTAPSHIFGTMHSADRQVAALPAPVRQVFDRAGSLTLEIAMNGQTQMELASSMLLFDGRNLADIAGPERLDRVVDAGARYGMPRERLMYFKPWALMLFFSVPPSEFQRQMAGGIPLDQILQQDAQGRGIALHALETIQEQIEVFGGLSETEQLALLDATMEVNPEIEPFFEAMREAYLARDLAGLHRLSEEMAAGTDPKLQTLYEDRLINARNKRMVARMTERLAEGKAFIAVGALHLSGEGGILNLLQKAGYEVSRVY